MRPRQASTMETLSPKRSLNPRGWGRQRTHLSTQERQDGEFQAKASHSQTLTYSTPKAVRMHLTHTPPLGG